MDIPLDLKLFMNNAAASKVYKCDQCNAAYSDKAYFEMHKQSHGKEVLQIVMPSGAGSGSSDHTAQQHLQDQINQQLRAFKHAYGSDGAQVYQVADGTYQVGRATSASTSSSSSTTMTHQTMNHQAQVNVPTYTAPTYIMTQVPLQHNRSNTQEPSHQQQQQYQGQQQLQLQQQVQEQSQIQQHIQHEAPVNTSSSQTQDKKRPYKCDQCPASFIDPEELTDHEKLHSGDGPFTCEECHFKFLYKSHYRSHLASHRNKPPSKPKKTRSTTKKKTPKPVQQQVQEHQEIHQDEQQIPQETQSSKKQYAKRNSEFTPATPTFKVPKKEQPKVDRPFECSECDASFQNLQELQTHKTKHTSGGPFKCEECQFVFLYREMYEAHRRRCEKKRKETNLVSRQGAASTSPVSHHSVEQHHVQQQQQVQQHQQVQQVQQIQQVHQVAHQQTQRPTAVSTVAQVHNIPQHQPAVIDMRSVQSQLQHQQVQQVQHLQHPHLIEQGIHIRPSGTIAGGRQDFSAVDMDSMNQIMNLIKFKGNH